MESFPRPKDHTLRESRIYVLNFYDNFVSCLVSKMIKQISAVYIVDKLYPINHRYSLDIGTFNNNAMWNESYIYLVCNVLIERGRKKVI